MENHIRNHKLNRLLIVSAFFAGILPAPWGYAQTCSERIAHLSYGIGIDMNGNVWVPQHFSGRLRKYAPDGSLSDTFDMQTSYNRGVAVTPVDNHIWVAHTGEDETDNRVTRYDALTGNLCEVIFLPGQGPSALAVDADGNVWVTNMKAGTPAIARIVPASVECDGTGQFLSTVVPYDIDQLEGGEVHPDGFAKPYNYSDMTGFVTLLTSATGTWTTVHDGGVYDAVWTKVTWNNGCTLPPPGTSLEVAVRAADTEVELANEMYQEGVTCGQDFVNVWGRYIQVRVRFRGSCEVGLNFATPYLYDLQVSGSGVRDCNHNNIDDACDIDCGVTGGPCDVLGCGESADCNGNLVPDKCEIDRNSTAPGWPFFCRGLCDPDCNDNGKPDSCDIAQCSGGDPDCEDCNGNGVPDWCDPNCDAQVNAIPDECEIANCPPGDPDCEDCDGNGVPDGCEFHLFGACCTEQDTCQGGMKKGCCESTGGQYLGDDISCVPDICSVGACCDDGSCAETDLSTCANGSFLGYGTTCDPNCCPQPETGHDSCNFAMVTQVHLPSECIDDLETPLLTAVPCDPAIGDPDCPPIPCTVDADCPTVVGTCGFDVASFCDDTSAMTCEPSIGLSSSVSLTGDSNTATADDCINLQGERVWWEAFVVDDCEGCADCAVCDNCAVVTMDFDCTDPAVTTFHTVVYEDCACGLGIRADVINVGGGNPSLTWSLPAGTYYYPILADDNGIRGPYQIHLEATRCRIAACCQQDACTLENRPACDALGGDWLGYGDQPIVSCQPGDCTLGLCCVDDGTCNDEDPLYEVGACTVDPANVYHGGVSCLDFTCPGPIMCDISAGYECKEPGGDLLVLSDLGACTRVADDFYPVGSSTSIENVCWRGAYHDFGGEPAGVAQVSAVLEPSAFVDCSGAYGDDRFTITIYDDAGGVPGAVRLSESFDSAGGLLKTAVGGGPIYDYSVTFFPTPSIAPNIPYWLEIQNDNGGSGSCYWVWESSGQAFNSVSARDDDNNWEIGDVQLSADQSMCLDGPELEVDPFDGTVITGACCFDGTGQCLEGVANYDCVGVFTKDATCSPDLCEFACCKPDCDDMTAAACTAASGVYSPGVRCAHGPLCAAACAQSTRCCYEEDAGPGCGDPSCCTSVCACDPYCCETEWDRFCVDAAFDLDLCDPNLMDECLESPLPEPMPCSDDSDCDGSLNSCQDGICPCSEDAECLSGTLCGQGRCYIPKNRYLSFQPNNVGEVAIQVTMTASENHAGIDGQPGAIGQSWWVGTPLEDGRSLLQDTLVKRIWTEPVLHVTGCQISPVATYDVRATVDEGLTFSEPTSIQTILKPGVKEWGDMVGFFDGVNWTPPNGQTSIDDAMMCLKTFQDINAFNATHFSVSDLVGVADIANDPDGAIPNGIVNINEVLRTIFAYQGRCYPFGNASDPCGPRGDLTNCVRAGHALADPPVQSTLSLAADTTLLVPEAVIDVDVFMDGATNLGGYQVGLAITGGETGSLVLEDKWIDYIDRPDYVFYSHLSIPSQESVNGLLAAVLITGGGIDVTPPPPAYLGTFRFRASPDASGTFSVQFRDISESFLLDGAGGTRTDTLTETLDVTVDDLCVADAQCNDGNDCTDDTCSNGTCVNTNDDTNTCTDGNDCTDDSCSSGLCVSTNDDTNTCTDGNECTDGACSGGTCVSTNDDTNTCTDGNDCTLDACVSGVCTSTNEPVNTVCDDGFFCKKRDRCDGAGVCVGTGNPCGGETPFCCEYLSICTVLPCQ